MKNLQNQNDGKKKRQFIFSRRVYTPHIFEHVKNYSFLCDNKSLIRLFTMLLISSVLNGCKKDSSILVEDSSLNLVNLETQRQKNYLISEYGFNEKSIQETENSFIVEGDVVFPKKEFWKNYLHDSTSLYKQYRSPNTVKALKIIEVNISSSVPSAWNSAFQTALSKWNGLNGKIKFKLVTGYCPAYGVTILYSKSGASNVFANADFPTSGGYPGARITVNSACTISTNTAQKLYTAVHELGHSIGFMHTDDASGYSQIISAISGCNTGTDPNSIMKQGNINFSDFSTCDKVAFKKLYP